MINMRITKDSEPICSACGNGKQTSIEIFDVRIAPGKTGATVFRLCDKCISEMFDKTLKARCMVDGMIKSSKQMAVINERKRKEMKKRENKEKQELEELKRRYGGDGD